MPRRFKALLGSALLILTGCTGRAAIAPQGLWIGQTSYGAPKSSLFHVDVNGLQRDKKTISDSVTSMDVISTSDGIYLWTAEAGPLERPSKSVVVYEWNNGTWNEYKKLVVPVQPAVIEHAGCKVFVGSLVNGSNSVVSVYDARSYEKMQSIPVGGYIYAMAVDTTNEHLAVSRDNPNGKDDGDKAQIVLVSIADGSIISRLPFGHGQRRPTGVAISNRYIVGVTNTVETKTASRKNGLPPNNKVTIWNIERLQDQPTEIAVDPYPYQVVLLPDDQVFVTHSSPTPNAVKGLSIFNLKAPQSIESVSLPHAGTQMEFAPSDHLYIASPYDGYVMTVNTETHKLVEDIKVQGGVEPMTYVSSTQTSCK